MDDLCGVYVFESSEELIEEEFVVLFSERLITFDDLGKVSIHHL